MKKILSALLVSGILIGTTGSVFAEEIELPYVDGLGYEVNVTEFRDLKVTYRSYDSGWKDFLGGRWKHGVDDRQVWSQYDHKDKIHKTTVRGAGGAYSYSGWTDVGKRALASWEKAWWGNKAWADIK